MLKEHIRKIALVWMDWLVGSKPLSREEVDGSIFHSLLKYTLVNISLMLPCKFTNSSRDLCVCVCVCTWNLYSHASNSIEYVTCKSSLRDAVDVTLEAWPASSKYWHVLFSGMFVLWHPHLWNERGVSFSSNCCISLLYLYILCCVSVVCSSSFPVIVGLCLEMNSGFVSSFMYYRNCNHFSAELCYVSCASMCVCMCICMFMCVSVYTYVCVCVCDYKDVGWLCDAGINIAVMCKVTWKLFCLSYSNILIAAIEFVCKNKKIKILLLLMAGSLISS